MRLIAAADRLARDVPEWFPQHLANEFYFAKGILSLIATILLVCHMLMVWPTLTSWARRVRYFALLVAAVVVTYASAEQVRDHLPVDNFNLGGMTLAIVLVAAGVLSLVEDRRRHA
jgi:hypothetical protein